LIGGVSALAFAACGETITVTKEVPVEVIKEVQVAGETVVKEVKVEVAGETVIKEVEVEVIKEVEVEVPVTVIKEVEVIREAARERVPMIDIHNLDEAVSIGLKPWDPKPGGQVSYMTFGNPTGFDPATWGGRSAEPANAMYDLLYTYGPGNTQWPWLASDQPTLADDKLSWVVPLRKNVQFQDGEPFNADAVIFNFDRFLDADIPRGHVIRDISSITGVEKVDDYAVRFYTDGPQAFFTNFLGHQHTAFGSPKAIKERGEDFARDPVGTGPWKFNKWVDDVEVIYDRNPDYNWAPGFCKNQGPAYPDQLKSVILGYNMTDNAQVFEAGEVDILLNWSYADYKRVSENVKYHVIGYAAPGMGQYLPLNTSLWPLTDLKVRQALLWGVDRRTVTVRANGGTAPLNISNLLVPGTIGRNPEATKLYSYDPSKANALLDEAGYAKNEDDGYRYHSDGRRLEIIYPDRGDPVVELFKLDVEKNLSIYVDTPKMEGATFRANMQEAAYHTVWIGVGGPTGDVMYDRMHTSFYGAPGRAYSFFEYDGVPATATPGAKIDKLMDGARGSFDPAEREKLWQEAELYLMQNAVAIPLVHDYLPWLTNPARVGGELFLGIDYLPNWSQWYSTQE
jgi:peptide/nickel transport system substrate-binding protein